VSRSIRVSSRAFRRRTTGTSRRSSCEVLARYAPKDGASGSVKIATALTGTEGERFEQSLARFEECTGIDVVHEGSDKLEENLRGRAAGTADWNADLAVVPQPGLVADLADEGALSPLSDVVGANVELGWDHAWSAAGTVDGTFYGAPLMASVKSFVWYSPRAFADAGYEVPATWDELVALTNRIAADHPKGEVTPWCLGMADGRNGLRQGLPHVEVGPVLGKKDSGNCGPCVLGGLKRRPQKIHGPRDRQQFGGHGGEDLFRGVADGAQLRRDRGIRRKLRQLRPPGRRLPGELSDPSGRGVGVH